MLFLLVLVFFILSPCLYAQDDLFAQDEPQEEGAQKDGSQQQSIDDLFNIPDSTESTDETGAEAQDSGVRDTEESGQTGQEEQADQQTALEQEPEQAPEQKVDLDELTTSPPKVSGTVTGAVGAGAGLMEWPNSNDAGDRTTRELMRYSGFFQNDVKLRFDVRPEPYIRFHTELEASLNDDTMVYSNPSISELFIDYTLGDAVFFRAGKQALTWGQGRLLDNPANLVSRVSEGIAFRSSFPAWKGSVGTVIYTKGAWVDEENNYDPKAFAYAAQWENTFGPVTATVLGHFKNSENIGSAVTLSFGLGPLNAAADMTAHWDRYEPVGVPISWQAMGQLGWDSENTDWTLVGEYQYDSEVENHEGHRAALAVGMPGLYKSDWKPKLRWKHAFQDNSGEVVAGLEGKIAPSLKLSLALPVIYGEVGSFYREALSEGVANLGDSDDTYQVPVDNVVSLLVSVKISFSF